MRQCLALFVVLLVASCSGSTNKLGVGQPCTPQANGQSTQCNDNLCIALDSNSGICSKSCAKDFSCPTGFSCQEGGQFGLVCLPNNGCKTDNDCPAGHHCDTSTGNCFIEVARQLCDPCEDILQCPQGGACFTAAGSGEKFCTVPCDPTNLASCPSGYACTSATMLGLDGGQGSQCVPNSGSCSGGKPLCAPCQGNAECGTYLDQCVRNVISGEQFCGVQCSPNRPGVCPANFNCTDLSGVDAGPFQCVPNSDTCQNYCTPGTTHDVILQCGVGNSCDGATNQCVPATDGSECAPCQTNDDCQKAQNPNNECVKNLDPNSPYFSDPPFCAVPCITANDCTNALGAGFVCSGIGEDGGSPAFCTPESGTCQFGLGQLGDSCSAQGPQDCLSAICLAAGLSSICSASCNTDSDCVGSAAGTSFQCCELVNQPDGGDEYDCTQRNSNNNGPIDTPGVCAPLGGVFGEDCTPGRPPCQTGACLDLGTADVCTFNCNTNADCPTGFQCQQAQSAVDGSTVNVCFPSGGGVVGSSCTFGPAACASQICIKKASGNVCTAPCSKDSDCPADWSCEKQDIVGGQQEQVCTPADVQ